MTCLQSRKKQMQLMEQSKEKKSSEIGQEGK